MATQGRIDLNCDLGEGYPHDRAIFPLVSSANIACGGHAGDRVSIRAALDCCARYGVAAGAHPGYPDPANFGRVTMQISREVLRDALAQQLDLFLDAASASGVPVHHAKLHGALYHDAGTDEALADMVFTLLRERGIGMVYGASGGRFNALARAAGLEAVDEVFADRAYAPDDGLLPRHLPGAVLADSRSVREQLRGILTRGEVAASDGTRIGLRAGTVCLHGDTAGAEAFIRDIRALLDELQIPVAAP